MTDSLGTTSYNYDALSRLTELRRFDGQTLAYTYDAVGNRIGLTYPDARKVQYEYDGANKLSAVVESPEMRTRYDYDLASRLVTTNLPNGIRSFYSYDDADQLLAVLNTAKYRTISFFGYTLDKVGNRIRITSALDGVSAYKYDGLNQLRSWTDSRGHTVRYSYDEVGNRVERSSQQGSEAYTYDDADELITAGSALFTYDGDGNRLSKTVNCKTTSFTWDSTNRLSSVTSSLSRIEYQYDGAGNRVGMSTGFEHHTFVIDVSRRAPQVVADYRGSTPTDYIYGYTLISTVKGRDADYLDYDGLGSAVNTSEADGSIRPTFSYGPWGETGSGDKGWDASDQVESSAPVRFAGQILDGPDDLYYLRARYYDPEGGRFLSPDPIGSRLGNPYDQNKYVYARNNPIRYVDPLGLSAEDSTTVRDFASTASTALSGLSVLVAPSTTTKEVVVAGGAAVGAVLYVAPYVASYCAVNPEMCEAIAEEAAELATQQNLLVFPLIFVSLIVGIAGSVLESAVDEVTSLWSYFGPSGSIWQAGSDSGPIVYPDSGDPSGVSDSNPNVPDDGSSDDDYDGP